MTIPESQATKFEEVFYNSVKPNTLENLKDRLYSKLYLFRKDQLDFLKVYTVKFLKTWFQLLKGKLVDVAIYNALVDGFVNGMKWLN